MPKRSRDIVILAAGQALSSTVVSLLTSVSSLSGAMLAPAAWLSTVPVTATVLGTLAMIYPASTVMGRLGRRGGFLLKAGIGVVGGAVCVVALSLASFALFVSGTFLLGVFSAFSQYYRFAAIDAAKSPDERTSAVATVTGAGVAGGFIGPFLGGRFADTAPSTPYAGAFVALCLVCVLLAASQMPLSPDLGREDVTASPATQPARRFRMNLEFVKATLISAIGFASMTLTMNAAPLSLHRDGIHLHQSAIVLQTHFVLMYVPSLFNAALTRWIGIRGMILTGIAANTIGCLLALSFQQSLALYVAELGLSGIAWNLLFNGGTLLLASTYAPGDKIKAQGLNSLIVYGANMAASLGAGVLMANYGWGVINAAWLPLLVLAMLALPARRAASTLAPSVRSS